MTKADFQTVLAQATEAGRVATIGMKDTYPCGGAYLTLDGNGEMVRLFKKYAERTGPSDYELGDWRIWKSGGKGYVMSNKKNGGYQNMQMHSAENTAYVGVFGPENLVASVHTYID